MSIDPSPLIARLTRSLAREDRFLEDVERGERRALAALSGAASAVAARVAPALRAPDSARPRVLLAARPGLDWTVGFLGILHAGGAVVPVPLGAPTNELEHYANDAQVSVALASHGLEGALPAGLARLELDVGAAFERAAPSSTRAELASSDVAMLVYTSGTTGRPKGVMLTHGNVAAHVEALASAWQITERDVLLHALPMHHIHGIVVAMLTALASSASVLALGRFDARRVFDELARATVFMGVPTMYTRLADAFDAASEAERERWSASARALRLATSGSAALPVRLAERWRAIAGAIPLERYGMTEIGIALSNPLDPTGRRPGWVGKPLANVEARVEDGALRVRGPGIFAGYFGRDERVVDDEGWFSTGDVAEVDERGDHRLLGRASTDILKSGGEKISALEVEEVLREHDAIAEVAVVGLPDEEWGQRVTAFVVLRERHGDGGTLGLEELRAWAKTRLAAYKVPRELRIVAALPRNAMGKVTKGALAAISAEGSISPPKK
ncbi:MAG: AMP-binding protein [Polyangiaceae bacterium]